MLQVLTSFHSFPFTRITFSLHSIIAIPSLFLSLSLSLPSMLYSAFRFISLIHLLRSPLFSSTLSPPSSSSSSSLLFLLLALFFLLAKRKLVHPSFFRPRFDLLLPFFQLTLTSSSLSLSQLFRFAHFFHLVVFPAFDSGDKSLIRNVHRRKTTAFLSLLFQVVRSREGKRQERK